MALREGLRQAVCKGFSNLLVEGDSQILLHSINCKMTAPWHIRVLVQDIVKLASQCDQIRFSHVLREANFLADALAAVGHVDGTQVWEHSLPSSTYQAFNLDCSGARCPPRGSSL